MKIGFFGGTFDPIHFGHINLALELSEIYKLDQVLFCPTALSPHKNNAPPAAESSHRKIMVEMAIASVSHFAFCDLEINRKTPSFTVDTIRMLKEERARDQFFLLLGEDALTRLQEWKNIKELIEMAPPLVGVRVLDGNVLHKEISLELRELVKKGMTSIHLMDISSTYLRERLRLGLYCRHLMSANVLDYIYANKLYSIL
ncbi:MAG: nicotinate-nucleotide adenylyltransferase [Chlamydiota bacterium]